MKLKGFVVAVIGGVVGAALLIGLVVALDMNLITKKEETVERVAGATTYAALPAGTMLTPQQIFDKSVAGVVEVTSTFKGSSSPYGGSGGGQGIGTGFVVDKQGYILTNQHVVVNDQGGEQSQQADSVVVGFRTASGQMERTKATIVGTDATADVALLKVDPNGLDLQPLTLGNSDNVQVGEPVVAIGNPLDYDFTLTSGIVSAVHRSLQAPNGRIIPNGIQTDAAINPGNSGGPLFNALGEVIGINEQIASTGGGNQGLGFAVPINAAKRSMDQLRNTGQVKYSWLGVGVETLTPDLAKTFNLPVQEGVQIASVVPDGPAAKAGIRGGDNQVTANGQPYTLGGDIITKLDGIPLTSKDQLVSTVSNMAPGSKVTLTVSRGARIMDIVVTLEERPAGQ